MLIGDIHAHRLLNKLYAVREPGGRGPTSSGPFGKRLGLNAAVLQNPFLEYAQRRVIRHLGVDRHPQEILGG